jgi:ElaA protein
VTRSVAGVSLRWETIAFEQMSTFSLHRILSLRAAVFVVEQACPYQDPDPKDLRAVHVLGWRDQELVAYVRVLPAGISFAEVSIGRVVTAPHARGIGLGRALMHEALRVVDELYGSSAVRISAQSYLRQFYESFGFACTEKAEYLEDGIAHFEMLRHPN